MSLQNYTASIQMFQSEGKYLECDEQELESFFLVNWRNSTNFQYHCSRYSSEFVPMQKREENVLISKESGNTYVSINV